MANHTRIPHGLQLIYLRLARFVLDNHYVECEGIPGAFLQKIGTAMGTSFSVTYATIFMIWLETPILDEFREHIWLYRRYIDDILLIWSGSPAELCRFRSKLGTANKNIKLEWQGFSSVEDATNPARFCRDQHSKLNVLDLCIQTARICNGVRFKFRVYRKPGNSYAYLPYGSYHARHVFRAWLKAELCRPFTHSSNPKVWME